MAKNNDTVTISQEERKKILLSDLYMDYKQSDISKDLSDEEIRKNVTDIYTKVNSEFSKHFTKHGDKARFGLNGFLDGMMTKMQRSMNISRKYDAKVINRIMEVPYQHREELLRISMYFYIRVQEYKGILEYKSNMLPYSYVLRPANIVDDSFDQEVYLKNLQFAKDYNIASKFGKVTKQLVRDDVYFAYEISDDSGRNYLWKELPNQYCTILGRDRFGTYKVGFDMNYFNAYPEDLDKFPNEFRAKYNDYIGKNKVTTKKGKGGSNVLVSTNPNEYEGRFYELDTERAIAFKFDESVDFVLPYYSGMFLDLVRLSELKDVEILSAISDNYKLVHQQVPMLKDTGQEDDFAISGEYLEDFHKNLKDNVPDGVGAVTSPMPITAVTLKSNVGSQEENIVSKHVGNLLAQSGTSTLLFNGGSSSALGLNKNIQVDENTLFKLLRQYELFMAKRLFLYNKRTHKMSLQFLDHTYYNTEELFNRYLKGGQFGLMPIFETASVMGVQQIDFVNNVEILNKLGIMDKMKPFVSSHTQETGDGEVGGKKVEKDLSEEGMRSRERDL